MTALSRPTKAVLAVVMVVDLATFSGVSVLKLMAFGAGTGLILLAYIYAYRQPAAAGMLIVSATAAASTELSSLLEVRFLLTGVIGLLIPVSVLTWVSLTLKDEGPTEETTPRRPMILASVYGALCLLSLPAALLIVSLVSPGMSLRTTTMAEGTIVLITAITGGMFIIMRGSPQTVAQEPLEEGA